MPFEGIPPWLGQSANPAEWTSRGIGLGLQAQAQRAAQQFQAMQGALAQQRTATENAQWQQEFQLQQQEQQQKAELAAQRLDAMKKYQMEIESGADPVAAMLEYGPAMGQQGGPEAAALRSMIQKPVPQLQSQDLPGGGRAVMYGNTLHVLPPTAPALTGPVQALPVLDPKTQLPIEGMIATPNATGRGVTVHNLRDPLQMSRRVDFQEYRDAQTQLKAAITALAKLENDPLYVRASTQPAAEMGRASKALLAQHRNLMSKVLDLRAQVAKLAAKARGQSQSTTDETALSPAGARYRYDAASATIVPIGETAQEQDADEREE